MWGDAAEVDWEVVGGVEGVVWVDPCQAFVVGGEVEVDVGVDERAALWWHFCFILSFW